MTADIYNSSSTIDDATGVKKKTYSYTETINCFARSVIRTGLSDNSTSRERESNVLSTKEIVKIRYNQAISTDSIVCNIKNNRGVVIWSENDESNTSGGISGTTIFEVVGNTPVLDNSGTLVEYEITVKRTDIQKVELEA
jgi:hypothetical protein